MRISYNIKWLIYLAILLFLWLAFILPGAPVQQNNKVTYTRPASDQLNTHPDKAYVGALLEQLNSEKAQQDDPRLIQLIRDHFIEAPSPLQYNLRNISRTHYSQVGQASYINELLDNKETGFFVECGAYNGERHTNTLYFEKTRHWKGLLIEADPIHYAALKMKNRNAFTINACLSLDPYPVQMTFNRNRPEMGRLLRDEVKPWMAQFHFKKDEIKVQCFPLYSILLALNKTNVDYFSLDIEGDELHVLKTIPFDKLHIKAMTVEVVHPRNRRAEVRAYMESQGHQYVKSLFQDLVFVRKVTQN